MRLTTSADRPAVLLAAGVPQALLDLLDALGEHPELDCELDDEAPAYEFFEDHEPDDLADQDVTPVLSIGTGHPFLLLVGGRFVEYSREGGVLSDYGASAQLALGHLLVEMFESLDDLEEEELVQLATDVGFSKPEALVREVAAAEDTDEQWRDEALSRLLR